MRAVNQDEARVLTDAVPGPRPWRLDAELLRVVVREGAQGTPPATGVHTTPETACCTVNSERCFHFVPFLKKSKSHLQISQRKQVLI